MPEESLPDPSHRRPDGVDDATVEAVGKVCEYYEWVVRARGRLYDFHQMMGHADAELGEAVALLEQAGHGELAKGIRHELLGRNVVPGQWTFEVVESYDRTYHDVAARWDQRVRDELMGGRLHVHEAQMKADRRTDGPSDDH